ncbi:zinc finger protein 12-like [Neocloeon triangulifer]|uniref:zinc finger protein 12-like n=1 Tax=Neocloeon triangulifer TaxID=2078957 RepID=UPI00286EF931|nr:zinc finger protein 12-like [Neocloeon triangulifer]
MGRTRRCIVKTCPNNDLTNVSSTLSLHRFPNDSELRRKWTTLLDLKYEDINPAFPHRYLVCQEHFQMERYHSTTCQLMDSYGIAVGKNCNRKCYMIPSGVLPTRNLPPIAKDLLDKIFDNPTVAFGKKFTEPIKPQSSNYVPVPGPQVPRTPRLILPAPSSNEILIENVVSSSRAPSEPDPLDPSTSIQPEVIRKSVPKKIQVKPVHLDLEKSTPTRKIPLILCRAPRSLPVVVPTPPRQAPPVISAAPSKPALFSGEPRMVQIIEAEKNKPMQLFIEPSKKEVPKPKLVKKPESQNTQTQVIILNKQQLAGAKNGAVIRTPDSKGQTQSVKVLKIFRTTPNSPKIPLTPAAPQCLEVAVQQQKPSSTPLVCAVKTISTVTSVKEEDFLCDEASNNKLEIGGIEKLCKPNSPNISLTAAAPQCPQVTVQQLKPSSIPLVSAVKTLSTVTSVKEEDFISDEEGNEDIESEKLCRFCAKAGLDLSEIYEDGKDLAKSINECLPFQVSKTDTLSLLICDECRESVDRMHKFYLQCKDANKKLRELNVKRKGSKVPEPCCTLKTTRTYEYVANLGDLLKKRILDEPSSDSSSSSFPDLTPIQKRPSSSLEQPSARKQRIIENPNIDLTTPTYSVYKFLDPKGLMQPVEQFPSYYCKRCPNVFSKKSLLCRHSWTHHSRLMCAHCFAEYDDRKEFEFHCVEYHKRMPSLEHYTFNDFGNKVCNFCNEEYSKFHLLRNHCLHNLCPVLTQKLGLEMGVPNKRFKCDLCDSRYGRKFKIVNHMCMHFGIKKFKCKVCKKRFAARGHLRNHMGVHKNFDVQCEECGASFKTRTGLRQHSLVHTGRWNNKCTCCSKTFRFVKEAKTHFRQHSATERAKVDNVPFKKVAPFECTFCQRPYRQKEYFDIHLKSHESENQQLCDQCGQSYKKKAALRQHILHVHGPQVELECNVCAKIFFSKNGLKNHMELHIGELLQCNVCGQGLVGRTNLRNHIRAAHGKSSYICDFCNKGFKLKKRLITHIKMHTMKRKRGRPPTKHWI